MIFHEIFKIENRPTCRINIINSDDYIECFSDDMYEVNTIIIKSFENIYDINIFKDCLAKFVQYKYPIQTIFNKNMGGKVIYAQEIE